MNTPLIVCGALGRMGRAVIDMAQQYGKSFVMAGTVKDNKSVKMFGSVPLYEDLHSALLATSDQELSPVIIDFSVKELALLHIAEAISFKRSLLIGTTGHNTESLTLALREASLSIAIVYAPNTSLMAHLMLVLTKTLAHHLPESAASIIDLHHAHKKDAPSGTAKELFRAITNARDKSLVPTIHSLRHGNVAGEHTVCFYNDFERLEIIHRVEDRRVFAQGALVAAQFLSTAKPGLYDMKNVLNMNLAISNEG